MRGHELPKRFDRFTTANEFSNNQVRDEVLAVQACSEVGRRRPLQGSLQRARCHYERQAADRPSHGDAHSHAGDAPNGAGASVTNAVADDRATERRYKLNDVEYRDHVSPQANAGAQPRRSAAAAAPG